MSLDDRTSSLVRSIYGSIDDDSAWEGVIDDMIGRIGARLMLVSAVDFRSGRYTQARWHGPGADQVCQGVREYAEEMFRHDPMLAFGVANPYAGRAAIYYETGRPDRDVDEDRYVRWVRDRLGVADSMVRYTPPSNGLTLGMSIHAPVAAGCHSRDSIDLFLMLFEHVERAMRVATRPPDFDSRTAVAVLVAQDGRIVRSSPAAIDLLDSADGLSAAGGYLVAASLRHGRRLDAAIRSALGAVTDGSAGGALALPRPSGRPDLLVRVDPMPNPPSPFRAFRSTALVSVVEPDRDGVRPDTARRWAGLFGLTPAEIRLTATLLADDGSLRAVADRLGIAYATARVQLASVFDKVGVNSQAQLARLLTRIG